MGFFNTNREEASQEETGGGKYINRSGIYDVTILAPFVDVNDKGARTVNFFVDYNGEPQVIYGNLKLDNNDGSPNFAANIFNKLCVIADLDGVSDPEEGTLPIGKGGADKDVAVLTDLQDLEVKMRVQMEYSTYNGDIKEKMIIKSFYRADGASGNEIINETEVGVNLEKDMAYAENVTYKDDLTPEVITQWIKDKRPKGTAGKAGASAGGANKPKPSFGRKK